jgi:NAD(P)-dependent dehydrogenase (short-subunit alcohol dehydrogenase family)
MSRPHWYFGLDVGEDLVGALAVAAVGKCLGDFAKELAAAEQGPLSACGTARPGKCSCFSPVIELEEVGTARVLAQDVDGSVSVSVVSSADFLQFPYLVEPGGYGPSKAALESETVIWAQDLAGTGVTVNALLPGGATMTGMIPGEVPPELRAKLLSPEIMVPPLLWLVSDSASEVSGKRVNASLWDANLDPAAASAKACEPAGWGAA